MIRRKPPEKANEAWTGNSWDSVPHEPFWIESFDALAINVYFKIIRHMRQPLDDGPLCAKAFVQKWANDS
jgi:hypothetical protein